MEIIVTHDMSDFDAFASTVAAQRLYPEATIVLGRRLAPALRDFMALHKDRFRAVRFSDIDPFAVTRMVVVDVRRASRLKDFGAVLRRVEEGDPELEVHVWDHHGASHDDVSAHVEVVEPVGSATTLLVEAIRARGLAVDPVEATLFAIGIYTDTGSLTHATTSSRDAVAVAWLLDRGASLAMVNRYLRSPFSPEQRQVLNRLLGAVHTETIGGVDIAIGHVTLDKAVDGLAEVTSEAIELGGHAALFAIYAIGGKRVQVVARSRMGWIDVGSALRAVGGGGHPAAGSAIVKTDDAAGIEGEIVRTLRASPPRPTRVADIMSSPVRTVAPDMPLEELGESLATWRHTGVPVVKEGRLAGIVSRRDVERAQRDGRSHLPVSSCMSHPVRTTVPAATLEEALDEMVDGDVGRLPVLRDDHLVGIVSRSDLLRVLYPSDAGSSAAGSSAAGASDAGSSGADGSA